MPPADKITELENKIDAMQKMLDAFIYTGSYVFQKDAQFLDGRSIQLAKGTGTKIGTEPTQKLGFWGKTPVTQQSAAGAVLGMTTPGGTAVTEACAFKGTTGSSAYTIHGIVEALKQVGILAL